MSSAHGDSLPLFDAVTSNSRENVERCIAKLNLGEHIKVEDVVEEGKDWVGLTPITDYGRQVLNELMARSVFPPCPEGECEFNGDHCRWCGQEKK